MSTPFKDGAVKRYYVEYLSWDKAKPMMEDFAKKCDCSVDDKEGPAALDDLLGEMARRFDEATEEIRLLRKKLLIAEIIGWALLSYVLAHIGWHG